MILNLNKNKSTKCSRSSSNWYGDEASSEEGGTEGKGAIATAGRGLVVSLPVIRDAELCRLSNHLPWSQLTKTQGNQKPVSLNCLHLRVSLTCRIVLSQHVDALCSEFEGRMSINDRSGEPSGFCNASIGSLRDQSEYGPKLIKFSYHLELFLLLPYISICVYHFMSSYSQSS